ncbi:unnamed protein product, partial [Prorocentrum cordatum]
APAGPRRAPGLLQAPGARAPALGSAAMRPPGGAASRLRHWTLLAAGGALAGHLRVRAMGKTVDEGTLTHRWTMLSGPVGLGPSASFEVTLRTDRPSPNSYVMFLSEFQWRYLISSGGQWSPRGWTPYPPCTWRASLVDAVNTSFPVSAGGSGRYFLGVLHRGGWARSRA